MRGVPRSIAELAFDRRGAEALLHLTEDRDTPDLEHYGFGWGTVAPLVLRGDVGDDIEFERVLVLALHSADEPSPDAAELELEFDIDYGPGPQDYVAIIVPLSRFVTEHLPRVLQLEPATDVVFALCNPVRRALRIPTVAGVERYWWAEGDVDSWRDGARFALTATRWHQQSCPVAGTP